ncbi:PLxRFG domain-containing protein [Xanthobacter sp. DSM 24535]|uniref:PLxRFG domain-containing protein n=1 Tax=Roseixanthobacter psychrophilus TaxID=3119917 RepID=UPI003726548C
MVDNVFQKSPAQLVLDQEEASAAPRGLPAYSSFAPPTAPAASSDVMKSAYEQAAIRYQVPVNVLMATSEAASDGPSAPMLRIDGAARKLRQALDSGAKIEDVVPPELLGRAAQIGQTIYADQTAPKPVQAPEPTKPAEPGPDEGPGVWGSLRDMTLQTTGGAYKGIGTLVRGAGALPQIFAENVTGPIINRVFGTDYHAGNLLDPAADAVADIGKSGQDKVSAYTKDAIKNSTPDGDLLKPSTWTLGKNPSLRGYMALGLDIFGGMVPIIASTVATGGGTAGTIAGAVTGGLQGGGGAIETARDAINELANTPSDGPGSPPLIEQQSAYYRELRAAGKSHDQAVRLTRSAAERFAFLFTTPVSALGGAATSKIINPAEHIISSRSIAARIGGRAALGALEEGSQETAETVETNQGINTGAGTQRSLTDGTFADFLLGALGGAAPGAAGGALSHRVEHAGAPEAQVTPDADATVSEPAQTAPQLAQEAVAPLSPAGPLSRALERAPVAPADGPRVTVVSDGIEPFSAVVEAQNETGTVLRDEQGNRYIITPEELSSGVVTIAQSGAPAEAQAAAPPETPSAPDPAEAVPPEQPTEIEPVVEGVPDPALRAAQEQQAPAPEYAIPATVEPKRDYASMTAGQLKQRQSYLANQAKVNGGWSKKLTAEKSKVDEALVALKPKEGADVGAADEQPALSATDTQAHEAATSPHNDLPDPTQAQKEAGNYKVGRISLGGLDISVENPQGSERKGVDASGKPWSQEMKHHYGYIRGTIGKDKDHVGAFVLPGTKEIADDAPVFVIDQHAADGSFDEHKVMLGYSSQRQAERAYRANYTKGWKGLGAVTQMTMGEFKSWVRDPAKTSKPAAQQRGLMADTSAFEEARARPPRALSDDQREPIDAEEQALLASSAETRTAEAKLASRDIRKLSAVVAAGYDDETAAKVVGRDLTAEDVRRLRSEYRMSAEEDAAPGAKGGLLAGSSTFGVGSAGSVFAKHGHEIVSEWRDGQASRHRLGSKAMAAVEGVDREVDRSIAAIRDKTDASRSAFDADPSSRKKGRLNLNDLAAEVVPNESGRGDHRLVLRDGNGEEAGGVSFSRTPDGVRVYDAGLLPEARGKGLVTDAYAKLADWAAENGLPLKSDANLTSEAKAIYERLEKRGYQVERHPEMSEWRGRADAPGKDSAFTVRAGAVPAKKSDAPSSSRTPERKLVGKNIAGENVFEDARGVRSIYADGIRRTESVRLHPGREGMGISVGERRDEYKTVEELAVEKPEAPAVSANTVFTEDAAEKARKLLRSRLRGSQLNSGIDPEIMQAGITLAGYHIEKGARTFAAYAKAMIADLGEEVKPYLKSWYMGVKYDPRATRFDGMSTAAEVEAADIDVVGSEGNEPGELDQSGAGALEGVPADPVQGASADRKAEGSADRSGRADASGNERSGRQRDVQQRGVGDDAGAVPVPARGEPEGRAGGERGGARVQRTDAPEEQAASGGERGRVEPASGQAAQDRGSDFTLPAEEAPARGQKAKFNNNIAAIRTLKELEASGAPATQKEQAILARYVGWGGIPQAFSRSGGAVTKGWEKEAAEMKALLTPEEYRAAEASTRNAHYTSPEIVRAMWGAMRHLGFKNGRVLEPSVGVGNFFALMPPEMRSGSALHGVELDNITGGIAKHLYPAAKIAAPMGFQDYTIPDGHFDLAIGNPPFGAEKLYDGRRKDLSGFSIHNYFFAKSLDGLRPGGVLAMVVTNRMMDGAKDAARQYISDRADLLGAIRLPNNAFLANAGTEVTTDIVILRKRADGEKATGESWMEVQDYTDANGKVVPLNEYFVRNPDQMLGEFGAHGTMYRPDDPALIAREDQDTDELLEEAIHRLPEGIMDARGTPVAVVNDAPAHRAADVRVGSMFRADDGSIMVRGEDSLGEAQATAASFPSDKARDRVSGMIDIRDAFADVRRLQLDASASDAQIEAARAHLNAAYDGFVKMNGPVNQDANKRLFRDDPSWPQISALEDGYDKGISPAVAKTTGEAARKPSAKKAAVFTKRTQRPYSPPTSASSAKDALVSSLAETGRVDIDMMQRLYGKPADAIVRELDDLVYQDPQRGWLTRSEYLSGNVKRKLAEAQAATNKDAAYRRNVEALEAIQPADVAAIDINVKPGAHWVPREVMTSFASHISGDEKPDVIYNPSNARWVVRASGKPENSAQWATGRVSIAEVLEAASNQRTITVRDRVDRDTTKVNEEQTQLANDKVRAVSDEWRRWIWSDDGRRESLGRLYNDMFNTDVQRAFDGSHLAFPGKVGDDIIQLRPHQANAVWRIVQSGTTLLDHVVGAGKTFTMVAAAMELRRMGLAKKPMFAVPNHLVGQWAADFVKLYPGAKVLATTKRDFEKENRKRLFARIATGDWDAVIVAHSSFGKVEVEPSEQAAFIEEQIADLQKSQELMREAEGKDGRNVKHIQNAITLRREKMKRLLDAQNKDDSLYWGELGVDALFTDEQHEFKNLEFSTAMQRVAGLGNQSGSQKASDMLLKKRQVLKATGGRNLVDATGTPISNTMAEMFTVQRYLDHQTLEAQGLSHFDAWARMFGEVVTDWELSPSGQYKMNSRFAKFVNMPELMQRYSSFADVVNRDDINRMLAAQGKKLPVPKVKGGKPENIVVERSPDQAAYIGVPTKDKDGNDTDQYPMGSLIWRAEHLPKRAEKGDDNMLKIMSDARKAALDMRLVDPGYSDHPGSKVNVAADSILRLHRAWEADRGTQLVFIDLSTPKASRGREAERIRDLIKKAEAGDETAQEALDKLSPDELSALESKFSVYDDLRQKLIDRGIAPEEIAFIHDANTDIQKEELFGKVRSGRVRVLFGSTAKMGAGMNVQDRLVGLHHLDAPWRPSDLEQREGRIIRQGNQLYDRDPDGFEVEINRYATKQTLDSRMWQTIEGKANFIEQVRKGNGDREIEDVGGEASNAAEMKAASSGNPLILEEMTLRQRIKRLGTERYGHDSEQFRLRDSVRSLKRRIETGTRRIAEMEADAKIELPAEFAMTVDGETYDKRREAGAAILSAAAMLDATYGESATLGSYGGFKLTLDRLGKDRFVVTLAAKGEYETNAFNTAADPQGVAQRVANAVRDLADDAARLEREVVSNTASVPKIEEQLRDWPKEADLAKAKADHDAVIEKLKPKKKAEPKEGGEAEMPAAKYSLSNLPVVDVPTDEIAGIESRGQARQKVRVLARERLDGKVVTTLDGDEVLISWQGIKHGTERANMPALAAMLQMDRLIASSLKSRIEGDNRDRFNISGLHEYAARAQINGKAASVRIFVREHADGKRYYDHAIFEETGPGWSPGDGTADAEPSLHRYGPGPATHNVGSSSAAFKSVSDAQDHLRSGAYGIQIGKMLDAGRVVIHEDQGSLPGSDHPDGRVQAMTSHGGKVHLVATNLTPANAQGVLLHELFHAGAQNMLGAQRYAKLMQRVRTSLAAAEQRRLQMAKGTAESFWQDALKRVDAANVPANLRAEELAAYAIEHRDAAPAGLREAVDGIIGTVKDWAVRTLGLQIGEVTPAQLHALARAVLRAPSALRGTQKPTRRGQTKSFSLKDFEPNDFIPAPDGTLDFGQIDAEVARVIRREAGPIRVKAGNKDFGLRHIEMKGDEITSTYADAREFVADVANSYDTIYSAGGRRLFLVKTVPVKHWGLVVEINPTPDGSSYTVVTGGARREDFFKNKTPLWGRAQSNQAVSSPPSAVSGQSGESTIPPGEDEAKGSRYSLADAIKTTPEQKDAWLSNKLSDTLTAAMPALLATVPLRPMLEELAKGMPAAREYLRTKQAMDTLRNEWHAKVAETSDAWLKYRSHNRDENSRLMEIMHDSTLTQNDPSEPFKPTFGAEEATVLRYGDTESAAYSTAMRKAADDKDRRVSYKEIKAKFDALSPDGKALYGKVRDTYSEMADDFEKVILENMDKALKIAVRRAEREHRAEMQRITDEGLVGPERDEAIKAANQKLKTVRTKTTWNARWRLSKMRAQFESNRLTGPYFPLSRFGEFFVTVRDKTGKVVSFSRFEGPAKQRAFVNEMRRDPDVSVEVGVLAEPASLRRQVDPNFVADVEEILSGAGASDALKDQVWQRYLESLPDYSVRKNRIHRLGRAGFQADALRAFASNLFHGAHQIARTKYGMDLSEHINDAREQTKNAPDPRRAGFVVNEMEKRDKYIMNPEGSAWAQAISTAAFVYHLALSPASALVNLTQTVIIGVPILAGYHGGAQGIAKASVEITRASRDFAMGKGKAERSSRLNDDERSAMQAAYTSGVIDKSQAHDLAGVGETGIEYSARRQKVMNAISWGFHQGERFNREVTFLAAYRMARSKGEAHVPAINTASRLTWKTHFDYQNTSRPRLMHGDAARSVLTFKNYTINMLFRLFRDTHQALNGGTLEERREARTQLLGITAMMFATGGIKSMWMFGISMMLASLFFRLSGHGDDDPEEELQKAVVGLLGPTMAGIALNGLPGHLMGISLSERIGMPDLWFRSPDRQLEGADAYHYWQDQMLGASFGILQNGFRGYQMISEGHVYRGIETIAPKAIRDLMRTYRYATEGATTLKGNELVDRVSAADLLKQALGFTPAQIAERYQLNSWQMNRQSDLNDERRRLLTDYARASKYGDDKALKAVEEGIVLFNSKETGDPITGKTIIQSMRAREKANDRNENGINLKPKLKDYIQSKSAPAIYD